MFGRNFRIVLCSALLLGSACGKDESGLDGQGNTDDEDDVQVGDGDGQTGDGDNPQPGDGDNGQPGDGDGDNEIGDGDGDNRQPGDGDGAQEGSTFPSVTDFSAKGPFATTTGPQPTTCSIHRPTTLGEAGRKHPVILWGNGTGTTPAIYASALAHWASHGFIVAAATTSNAGSGKEMLDCLTYLEAQNQDSTSPYAGKVDVTRVGASGHSQGGAGSLMAGADPRVSVTAPLQPYIFYPLGGFSRDSLTKQTGPMFLLSGSADTIAGPTANQKPIFDTTNVPVVWGTLQGATHTGDAIGDLKGYRGPSTAWFRLQLMNDASARPLFYGATCGLCSDATWTVQRRQIN